MNFDPRLLRLLGQSKRAFTITIALGLTGGALAIWQARAFAHIVDLAFLKQAGFQQVYPGLITLLVVVIIRAVATWGFDTAGGAISNPIKRHLRHKLYQRILKRGPVFTNRESTGELVNTTVEGVEGLEAYFSQYIPQVILAVLIPILFLFFIAPVDWISALVMLFTAPLIPFFMALIGHMAQVMTRRQWLSLSRMSAYFLDVIQGLTTLKTLGRSREQGEVIARVSQRYAQTTMGVLRVAFLSALTLELIATLSTAVVAVQLGLRLLYGWISFEQALFVLALAPEFYLPLRMLGTRFHAGMAGVEAGKRIFQVLGDETISDQVSSDQVIGEKVSGPQVSGDQVTGAWVLGTTPTIKFREVEFAYETRQGAINGVSFTINPGEKIALVGASGAGKSTLASLLMGFLQPDKGEILVGDIRLSDIPLESWRARIAWVPQKPYLFRDSIAANICLANPAASAEVVIQAAQMAHADEFIRELPQGYDTIVGERGARLSAGQAQRIALARAFLKDAPLLILDEGTAHLDAFTASQVQDSIQELSKNRTVVVIAHQLSTVTQADRILVMNKRCIVQSGKHAELAQQDGLYRQLLESDIFQQCSISEIESKAKIDHSLQLNENYSQIANLDSRFSINGLPLTPHPSPFTLFFRLIHLILPYSGWIILSALLGFATIASSVGLAATSAYIISAAALQPSIAILQVAIVGVRFFGLSRGVFRYLERYVSHKVTLQVLGRLRVWFYDALEPLAPARLLVQHSGDLLSRIIGDISSLENFFVRALYPPLVAILTAGLLGVYLGMYSLHLTISILVIFIGACIAIPWLMNRLGSSPGKAIVDRRAALNERLVEGIQGMADLLIYGRSQSQAQRIDDAGRGLEAGHQKMAMLGGLQNGLMGLISNLSLWIVLCLAIPLVDSNLISGVYLASLALAALAGFEAASPLPIAGQHLASNLQAARRLFEMVDGSAEVVDPQNPLTLPEKFDLVVDRLSFRYQRENLTPPTPLPEAGRGEKHPLLSMFRGKKGEGGTGEDLPPPPPLPETGKGEKDKEEGRKREYLISPTPIPEMGKGEKDKAEGGKREDLISPPPLPEAGRGEKHPLISLFRGDKGGGGKREDLTPPPPFPETGRGEKHPLFYLFRGKKGEGGKREYLIPPPPLPETGRGEKHPLISLFRGEKGEGGIREVASYVLHNLSFSLPQGKRIVIVGPSGEGKTTLVNLLLRFWEFREGSIKLGGNDIRLYRQDDLRKMMAVVSQNTYLFNTTLRENLLLARPDATQEQVMKAIQQAQLGDLVKTLPQGLDTWLGEQGIRLSAGERQRVTIARALLMDAPILILDEATANLDTQTERQVMAGIEEAAQGKSVIMITHHQVGLERGQVLVMRDPNIENRES